MTTDVAAVKQEDYDYNIPTSVMCGSAIPEEIRKVRNEVAYRIQQEHTFLAGNQTDGDYGAVHKEGSARAFVKSGVPGSTTTTMTDLAVNNGPVAGGPGRSAITATLDEGRLYVDSATNGLYYINSTTWTEVAVVGSIAVSDEYSNLTLLGGRAGGQVIRGGTAASDDLTLQSTNHGDKGDVIIPAGEVEFQLNDVPVSKFTLKAGTTFAAADVKLTGLGLPTAFKDAIRKEDDGAAIGVLSSAEVQVTSSENNGNGDGGIALGANGIGTGSDSTARTVDVNFNPDFIIVWNSSAEDPRLWTSDEPSITRNFNGSSDGGNPRVSVSSSTITFPANRAGGNNNGSSFFYVAFRTNLNKNPT